MSDGNVLGLFNAPGRQDCLAAVARALLRIRSNGWSREALGKVLECSPDTIDNATNEKGMLCFVSIARMAFHFPDEFALIQAAWTCCDTARPTPAERLDRIEREFDALRKEIAA